MLAAGSLPNTGRGLLDESELLDLRTTLTARRVPNLHTNLNRNAMTHVLFIYALFMYACSDDALFNYYMYACSDDALFMYACSDDIPCMHVYMYACMHVCYFHDAC